MKTKIKYISIVYNTANYVYIFRMNLIKALQKQGYTIVAITPYDKFVSHHAHLLSTVPAQLRFAVKNET